MSLINHTACNMCSLFASTTPSLEPVVVLCGKDIAATAVLVAMNGKQTDESHSSNLSISGRRFMPVALVRWLVKMREMICYFSLLFGFFKCGAEFSSNCYYRL